MIPQYPNIPKDILDYINSHPVYGSLSIAKVDWDYTELKISVRMTNEIRQSEISMKNMVDSVHPGIKNVQN